MIKLQKLNSELSKLSHLTLGPRFRLSKLDLEDVENSSVIKAGDWDSQITKQLLMDVKKKERRKLYYKHRLKTINV